MSAAIFSRYCLTCAIGIFIFNKSNPSGSTALLNQFTFGHLAVFAEYICECVFVNIEAERFDKNFFVILVSTLRHCGTVCSNSWVFVRLRVTVVVLSSVVVCFSLRVRAIVDYLLGRYVSLAALLCLVAVIGLLRAVVSWSGVFFHF